MRFSCVGRSLPGRSPSGPVRPAPGSWRASLGAAPRHGLRAPSSAAVADPAPALAKRTPSWLAARGWDPARAAHDLAAHAEWRAAYCPHGRVLDAEVSNDLAQNKVGGGVYDVVCFTPPTWWSAALLQRAARGRRRRAVSREQARPALSPAPEPKVLLMGPTKAGRSVVVFIGRNHIPRRAPFAVWLLVHA